MGLADLFASNLIVKWLRGDTGRHELTVTMSGLERGDRVVQLGGDPSCIAALGVKTGLSGRAAFAATQSDAVARADQAAAAAGVLVETVLAGPTELPFEAGAFDLALVDDPTRATGAGGEILMRETFRILREGGRCLFVVELASKKDELPSDQLRAEPGVQHALSALTSHGFRGARVLAARENRAYVEAAKPRSAGASA